MSKYEIVVEYKNTHLTRPVLHKIIGAAIDTRQDVDEIIVRCRSATRTAVQAVKDITKECKIRNSKGKNVKIVLAPDYGGRG